MARLLGLEDVHARYGPVQALSGVSLSVGEGEVVAVLGGNGAGKTTTLRAISGLVTTSGQVRFAGKGITRAAPERVARAGVAHVPEGRGIFRELTVHENPPGAYRRKGSRGHERVGGLPLARGAAAAGRNTFGRRAADARDRPRRCRGRGSCSSTSRRRARADRRAGSSASSAT
jgi:ABC-type branched-subunit amino acid transport system ATPase component